MHERRYAGRSSNQPRAQRSLDIGKKRRESGAHLGEGALERDPEGGGQQASQLRNRIAVARGCGCDHALEFGGGGYERARAVVFVACEASCEGEREGVWSVKLGGRL